MEVLKNAHKKTAEVMKSVNTLHGQFVKQTFVDLNSRMRGMMTKKPDYYFGHVETMKNSFHRAIDHAKCVKGMLVDSHTETHTLVYERLKEAKERVKAHIAKRGAIR